MGVLQYLITIPCARSDDMNDSDDAESDEGRASWLPLREPGPPAALPLEPPLWDCPSGRRLLQRCALPLSKLKSKILILKFEKNCFDASNK